MKRYGLFGSNSNEPIQIYEGEEMVQNKEYVSIYKRVRHPKSHIPKAIILSLLIQGLVCYLIEYFAANYFMHNGYQVSNALGSAAPIGGLENRSSSFSMIFSARCTLGAISLPVRGLP